MPKKTFYITTTTPYVNAEPHIGFAFEIVAADVIARYQSELLGKDVVFNTGTDEHGQKIYQKALEEKLDPQAYTDKYAPKFKKLRPLLNLSYTHFIRTTEDHHKQAAQEFWKLCDKNGDIYKKLYEIKYCVGCELEKTDSELENGCCILHPTLELEVRKEENYFFRFSNYQEKLLELYKNNPRFVRPESKMKEIASFVAGGLQDFSISRLKKKMPWGVAVPGDQDHVMYVWFDALVNYISTLGWPENKVNFDKYWPGMQIAGKDNVRQQAAMWQAMLMSAKLPNSIGILINGFISIDGQKMSKSLGNVITPQELVDRYGVDGARYLLMNLGPVGGDMDVSWEKLDTIYTADLSNGLGNLCSRVAKMCESSGVKIDNYQPKINRSDKKNLDDFMLSGTLRTNMVRRTNSANRTLSTDKPWLLKGDFQKIILQETVYHILDIAYTLQPFIPETAKKILKHFSQKKITALKPLFPRLK